MFCLPKTAWPPTCLVDRKGQPLKLYVGNLSYSTNDSTLSDLFSQFGSVESAHVITDRDTGKSKGFGFVEFANAEIAKQAMSLNGKDFDGRALTVNEARPKR